MLPARHRMRRAPDFASTVRHGARAGGEHLVVHLLLPPTVLDGGTTAPTDRAGEAGGPDTVVGLIVSRAVGDAVRRTSVKRRLRHVMAQRLDAVPTGSAVVVRAAAGAAQASSAVLAAEVDAALARALRPRRSRAPRAPRAPRPPQGPGAAGPAPARAPAVPGATR